MGYGECGERVEEDFQGGRMEREGKMGGSASLGNRWIRGVLFCQFISPMSVSETQHGASQVSLRDLAGLRQTQEAPLQTLVFNQEAKFLFH